MRAVPHRPQAETGGLLCLLLLRIGALSVDSGAAQRWRGRGLPMLTQRDTACDPGKDWVRRPASAILWWCLPLGAATVVNVVALSPSLVAAAWSVAFSWMGTGCILNARRCSRLHCYISGP